MHGPIGFDPSLEHSFSIEFAGLGSSILKVEDHDHLHQTERTTVDLHGEFIKPCCQKQKQFDLMNGDDEFQVERSKPDHDFVRPLSDRGFSSKLAQVSSLQLDQPLFPTAVASSNFRTSHVFQVREY